MQIPVIPTLDTLKFAFLCLSLFYHFVDVLLNKYMPYRRPSYVTNQYYHLYNRGVEKHLIFRSEEDWRVFQRLLSRFSCRGYQEVSLEAYCLMPNHFHLLVKQLCDSGICKFLQRLLTTYAMYFNHIYQRVGPLFQGRTKARYIGSDQSYKHISRYIHRNPLKLLPHYSEIYLYKYSSFRFFLYSEKARGGKLLSLFEHDPIQYEQFVLFDKPRNENIPIIEAPTPTPTSLIPFPGSF